MAEFYTVGHSNYAMADFVSLLRKSDIEVVVDVRSAPYSRYSTHFNGPFLKKSLEQEGLKYLYLGKELGGMPKEAEYYDENGNLDYARIKKTEHFREGMERLYRGIEKFRVAIMCGEENPSGCHRHKLIAQTAREQGISVIHIRKGGMLQSDEELIAEYAPELNATQLNLFG